MLGRSLSDILMELTQELIISFLVHFPSRYWAGNKEPIFQYLEADIYLVHLYFMISLLLFSVLSWEKGVTGLLQINQYQSINILYFTTSNSSLIQNDFVILVLLRTIIISSVYTYIKLQLFTLLSVPKQYSESDDSNVLLTCMY